MHSVLPPTSIAFERGGLLSLPMEGRIRAGFPSPAADFSVKRQDLNELLITHPAATFFWTVAGKSMFGAVIDIDEGDILVVNRALASNARHGDIVVAEVDQDFTVKYLHKRAGQVQLRAADPTFPPIIFKDGQTGTLKVASEGRAGDKRAWSMRQPRRTPHYTTSWTEMPVARA